MTSVFLLRAQPTLHSKKSAFSLVELSIVLVILGLLVGGILTGRSLIHASELRAVGAEYQRYVTATHSFRDKYFALPGDMANATSIWGIAAGTGSDAACAAAASTDAKTCNGDGDGGIELTTTGSAEMFRYWQHLANAGLIEGSYTGKPDAVAALYGAAYGSNIPRSKLPGAGWSIYTLSDVAIGGFYGTMFVPENSNNWLSIAVIDSNGYNIGKSMSPEDAWNIDTKIDDGLPGKGRITTFNTIRNPSCPSGNTASTATYVLTATDKNCTLFMGF